MKRDMDLIRQIAFQIEESTTPVDSSNISIEGYDSNQIAYNVELMVESNLVLVDRQAPLSVMGYLIVRLSSFGHDFVDAARNETIWKKATKKIRETVGGVAIEVLIAYLKQQANELLGLGKTQQ